MKKTFFIIVSILFVNQLYLNAQDNVSKTKSGKIGITYSSFGENDVFRFNELDWKNRTY